MQSLPAIMPIKIPYSACPVLPVLSCLVLPCLASTPSECLYHVCIFVAALQSTYPSPAYHASQNPRMILCQSPPRLDNRPTREADAQQQPQINTLRPAYTACTSIRRSTMVDSLVPLLLAPAHALPRSRSNDRQGREIVRYAAPTRLISLSAICRTACASQQCQHPPLHHVHFPFFHPRVCRGSGVGSYRADATEAARDRRAYAALPNRDEGLVVQMVFCLPVRPLANDQLTDFSRRR